jgi:hypothetical protein
VSKPAVRSRVEDFQFGDALAVEVLQPRLLFKEVGGEGVVAGHPAVALAQQADEERTAGADFVEAEPEGFLAGTLPLSSFIIKPSAFSVSLVCLLHHVAERRRNKNADAAVLVGLFGGVHWYRNG